MSAAPTPVEQQASRHSAWNVPAAVAAVLLLQVALFAPSFSKFFCGDSLYFLSRRVTGFSHLLRLFTSVDPLFSYRPLSYTVFTYLMYPLSGLNPLGYHIMTLGAHLLTSVLFFLLLRRLVSTPAAALAGFFYFGVHELNFYLAYDATFLPDYGMALPAVAALLAYARSIQQERGAAWNAASVALFAVALGFKESAVTLPAGLVVVGVLAARKVGRPYAWRPLLPHLCLTAAYLGFQWYVRGGRLYPEHGNYQLSAAPLALADKLRYFPWLFNISAESRQGWLILPAVGLMLPALYWMARRLGRVWRVDRTALLLCAAWAVVSLSPVLLVNHFPIEDLFFAVAALALALALGVDREAESGFHPARAAVWFVLPMTLSVAFQVRNELKYSWVAQASDIAQQSLGLVQHAHPTLPAGALLYVLPGANLNTSWYFDQGSLFSLFYGDPGLQMRFADQGHRLPADFARRPDVFIYRFHDHRLWEVTRQYKLNALDRASDRLLEQAVAPQVESRLQWPKSALIAGKNAVGIQPAGRNGQSRLALLEIPATTARLALPLIPPNSVLQAGVSPAGPLKGGTRGQMFFEDAKGKELLLTVTLDGTDVDHWWDTEIDLSRFAGRDGTLVLENFGDPGADWIAWSRLRLIQRNNPYYSEAARDVDQLLPPREFRLLDRFDEAEISFDRGETYPDYSHFDTPGGAPAFLFAGVVPPGRFAMVTIAGATARFKLDRVPPGAALQLSATNLGTLGDGVQARVFVEAGGRELLFDELLPPRSKRWTDRSVSLAKWEGRPVTLAFEASSGPNHQTAGDWCAWARLRIVSP